MQPSPAAVRFSFLHRNTPSYPAVKAAFVMLCPWARWAGFCSARNLLAPGFFSPSRYPTGTSLSPASLSVLHPSPRAPHGSARSAGDKAQGDKVTRAARVLDPCPGQCPGAGTSSAPGQGDQTVLDKILPPSKEPSWICTRVGLPSSPRGFPLSSPPGCCPWKREAGSCPKPGVCFPHLPALFRINPRIHLAHFYPRKGRSLRLLAAVQENNLFCFYVGYSVLIF